jgi:hypothetical protein
MIRPDPACRSLVSCVSGHSPGESVANIDRPFKAECWHNPQPCFETEYCAG